MKSENRFPNEILATIHKEKILGIRAGKDSIHRVIGIWAVIVEGRVFVRSWSLKPRSWWRTCLEDPYGSIFIGEREIPVRAVQTRSECKNNPTFSYELRDDVFTWGEQGFSFYSSYSVDGQYAVGIIAYDFDNNFIANFEFINYAR